MQHATSAVHRISQPDTTQMLKGFSIKGRHVAQQAVTSFNCNHGGAQMWTAFGKDIITEHVTLTIQNLAILLSCMLYDCSNMQLQTKQVTKFKLIAA